MSVKKAAEILIQVAQNAAAAAKAAQKAEVLASPLNAEPVVAPAGHVRLMKEVSLLSFLFFRSLCIFIFVLYVFSENYRFPNRNHNRHCFKFVRRNTFL